MSIQEPYRFVKRGDRFVKHGETVFPARVWELSPSGGWCSRAATSKDTERRIALAEELNSEITIRYP